MLRGIGKVTVGVVGCNTGELVGVNAVAATAIKHCSTNQILQNVPDAQISSAMPGNGYTAENALNGDASPTNSPRLNKPTNGLV